MALDNKMLEKIKQQKEKMVASAPRMGTSAKFWKPKEGDNPVRVMPCWTDQDPFVGAFWREVAQHWGVSPDQKGPILCVEKTPFLEGSCPICAFVDELRKDTGNVEAQELAKTLRAKIAYLVNLVDLTDPVYTAKDVAEFKKAKPDVEVPFKAGSAKIQVYACPKMAFESILDKINTNAIDITDLEAGHDLIFNKTSTPGNAMLTKYKVEAKFKPSESAVTKEDTIPDLERVGFVMKEQEMLRLLAGGAGEDYVRANKKSKGALTSGETEVDDLETQMRNAL